MIKKRFIRIKDRQIHFRYTGKGSPIVLFHASPESSISMIPLMEELSLHFLVIAVDTPGYGLSDPLAVEEPEMKDYIEQLQLFFEELELADFAVYGSAMGAQLAIRYALTYPKQVCRAYLDHAAHFTDEQYEGIISDYFPDLEARYDGSHLTKMWKMIKNRFAYFPWSSPQPENRLDYFSPSAATLHQLAQDYLQSGSDYDKAYRAGFLHARATYVKALSIPTTIFDNAASPVRRYTRQLLDFDLPDQIEVCSIASDQEQESRKIAAHIFQTYTSGSPQEIPSQKLETFGQAYLPASGGFLHALVDLRKEETPLVLLHDWRSSAAIVHAAFKELGIERPYLAISLPGHGDSDHFMESYVESKVAKTVTTALARIGIEDYEVAGLGRGMSIAQQIHLQKEVEVDDLFGVQQESFNLPKLLPDEYGQYLTKAWSYLQKYSPAHSSESEEEAYLDELFNSMRADELQLQLREWLKCKY